jgi:hypothetical protein
MEVPAGATRCPNCSAAQGPLDPCPHCRAQAGISPDREFRWVCDVCGGPRVPRLDASIDYGGRDAVALRKADAARKGRAGWRAAAIASGLALPVVLLFVGALLLLFGLSFALAFVALVAIAPVAAFLAFAVGRAGKRSGEIGPAIDAAWLAAATAIARQSPGPVTAASLSQKLGVEEPQAEELMALLDVNEAMMGPARVRIDVPARTAGPATPAGPATHAGPASGLPTQPTQLAGTDDAAMLEQAVAEEAAAEAEALRRKGTS